MAEKKSIESLRETADDLLKKYPAPTILKLVENLKDTSVIKRRFIEYQKIKFNGKELSIELIQKVQSNIKLPNSTSAKRIAGILVLLGLLGTLLGLSVGVTQMQNLLNKEQNFTLISNSMIKFIEGMSTAFSTTLAGIIATLFLMFVIFLAEKFRNSIEVSFEMIMVSQVLPVYSFSHKKDDLAEIKEIIKDTRSVIEKVTKETINTNLDTRQLFTKMHDSVLTLTKSIETISEPFKQSSRIQDQMLNLLEKIEKSLSDSQGISHSISDAVNRFTDKTDSLNYLMGETLVKMSEQNADLQLLRESLSDSISWNQSLTGKVENLSVNTHSLVSTLKELIPEMRDLTVSAVNTTASNMIDQINILKISTEEIFKSYIEQMQSGSLEISSRIRNELSEVLNSVLSELSQIKESIIYGIHNENQEFSETIEKNTELLSTATEKVHNFQSNLLSVIDAQVMAMEKMTTRNEEVNYAIMDDLSNSRKVFIDELGSGQIMVAENIEKSLKEQLSELSHEIKELTNSVSENLVTSNGASTKKMDISVDLAPLTKPTNQILELLQELKALVTSFEQKKKSGLFGIFGGSR
ncbi:hypothetical protein MASR2M39_12250 [Ignavibacteriales bacterium]